MKSWWLFSIKLYIRYLPFLNVIPYPFDETDVYQCASHETHVKDALLLLPRTNDVVKISINTSWRSKTEENLNERKIFEKKTDALTNYENEQDAPQQMNVNASATATVRLVCVCVYRGGGRSAVAREALRVAAWRTELRACVCTELQYYYIHVYIIILWVILERDAVGGCGESVCVCVCNA